VTNLKGRAAEWTRRGPLLAAAAVFAGLSLAPWQRAETAWVVTAPVAPGERLTAANTRLVTHVDSIAPKPGMVARVALEPGQTLVPEDMTYGLTADVAQLTIPVGTAAAQGLMPGETIQFAEVEKGGVWLSPPVTVVDASGAGLAGSGGTVTVTAPLAVLTAILPHAGAAWILVDPPREAP
jgi:hypothetical protein